MWSLGLVVLFVAYCNFKGPTRGSNGGLHGTTAFFNPGLSRHVVAYRRSNMTYCEDALWPKRNGRYSFTQVVVMQAPQGPFVLEDGTEDPRVMHLDANNFVLVFTRIKEGHPVICAKVFGPSGPYHEIQVRSPWPQKNWVPVGPITSRGVLFMAKCPQYISDESTLVDLLASEDGIVESQVFAGPNDWKSSTPFVPYRDGLIGFVHRRVPVNTISASVAYLVNRAVPIYEHAICTIDHKGLCTDMRELQLVGASWGFLFFTSLDMVHRGLYRLGFGQNDCYSLALHYTEADFQNALDTGLLSVEGARAV